MFHLFPLTTHSVKVPQMKVSSYQPRQQSGQSFLKSPFHSTRHRARSPMAMEREQLFLCRDMALLRMSSFLIYQQDFPETFQLDGDSLA
jgi:hypothetical protein